MAKSILFVGFNNCGVLLFCPPLLFDIRIQVVVPSFSALFADPAWQILRDVTPISGSPLLNKTK